MSTFAFSGVVSSFLVLKRSEYLEGSFDGKGGPVEAFDWKGARGGIDIVLQVVYVWNQTQPNSNFLKFKGGSRLGLSPYSLLRPE